MKEKVKSSKNLSKNQLLVMDSLKQARQPLGAYSLLDKLREKGLKAPLQVYRTLDHLDIRHQLEVLTLLRGLPLTVVTSLHDLNFADQFCDEVLLLQAGYALGFGSSETVFTELAVSKAFCVTARQEKLFPSDTQHMTFHL